MLLNASSVMRALWPLARILQSRRSLKIGGGYGDGQFPSPASYFNSGSGQQLM
jgi:hypothetical protein